MARVRRCAVALGVVLACFVASTVQPEPAAAYYDAITTAQDWEIVNGWLNGSEQPPLETVKNRPGSAGAWFRARRAIGRVPSWGATGSGVFGFTLAAGSALYLGWEIGHASGASDWAYGKIVGWGETAEPQPSAGAVRAYYWKVAYVTGSIWNGPFESPLAGCSDSAGCWVPEVRFSINSGSTWNTRTGYAVGCFADGPGVTPCDDMYTRVNVGGCYMTFQEAAINSSLAAAGWAGELMEHVRLYSENGDTACMVAYGESTADAMARFRPTEQRPYSSTSDAYRKTHTAATGVPKPAPTPAYPSGAGVVEAEAAIEGDDELAQEIGTILHPSPGGDDVETIALPQPRLNETYAQYRSRLRALGYLGTITLLENAGVDVLAEFGPLVVTQVNVTTTTGTELYPLLDPWPDPPPTLAVPGLDLDVTILYNPEDAPAPEPGEPGSPEDPPPGNAPPPGGGGTIDVGNCTCPAPDFSPITDADLGDKFPFSIIAMAVGVLGTTLYATPDAPVFAFDFADTETPVGTYDLGNYDVDLVVLDEYMALVRTILSWCIWIGGLWWFGSRWFGFHGTGDPGGAVDDVL